MSPAAASPPLPIVAHGMCCAVGRTVPEVVQALSEGRSGLVPCGEAQGLPMRTWFGAVPGTLAPLPASLASFETRQARLAMHVGQEIDDTVRRLVSTHGADRVAIVLGTTTGGVGDTEAHMAAFVADGVMPSDYSIARHHAQYAAAQVLAQWWGVEGPVMAQVTACSSSTKVFDTARRLLMADVVDVVVAGGVDSACHMTLLGFDALGVTTDRRCAPFAASRSGINLGEGGALAVVTRDGPALAYLRGAGATSDAHHMTQPHPEGDGVARAMREAVARSGLLPDDIAVVHPHATGTTYNDASEARAIATVFPHRPPVMATKGYTGHTLGAAGALGVGMMIETLRRGWAPVSLTDDPLDAAIDLAVTRERTAGPFSYGIVVSAAFAGHNAAIVLGAP